MVKISEVYPELILVKKWNVRSSSDPSRLYLVEKMADGSLRCDCPAGLFNRECRHKSLIREKLNFKDK